MKNKKTLQNVLAVLLACMLVLSAMAPACAETPTVQASVQTINAFGNLKLDVSPEDLAAAGFDLGDIVAVKAGSYEGSMPYLNGYYVDREEYVLVAYPGEDTVTCAINYGQFAAAAGVGPGDPVTLTLEEKAGALEIQEVNNLVYTNDIEDYNGDEAVFANFRYVEMGNIGPEKLYRAASPVRNEAGRDAYADRLAEEAGIRTVMNMADTDEQISESIAAEDYASPYYQKLYEEGKVIALGMPIDFTNESFGKDLVKGLTFLAEGETPFLIHCKEGKDRTGFAVMLLEMLCGASPDDIIKDYMLTYMNYYGVEEDTEKYDMIAENNVIEMMRVVCGLEDGAPLDGVDLKAGAQAYLEANGMTEQAMKAIEEKLR